MNALDILYVSLAFASLLVAGALWYFVVNVNVKLTYLINSFENSMKFIDDTAKAVNVVKDGVSYGALNIFSKLLKIAKI